jgi:transcriptional regulator with XRE-family HTH domain
VSSAEETARGAEASVTSSDLSALAVFASELRAQRQAREWTQAALGDKIGYSASFVSDVERCERTPRLDFAQACDREMDLPGSFARLHDLIRRAAYPAWFYPVIPFEAKAVRIHGWELGAVPGLLQTEDYARALIRASRPQDSDAAVDALVSARMERQAILAGEHAPMLWYVLDEGVLRRMVGGTEVISAQLDRLLAAAGAGGFVFQVLPFSASDQAGADGPISVFEFNDAPTVCYTECYRGGRVVEDRAEVAEVMTTVSMLRASALSPRDSLALIRGIRRAIDGQ